MKKGLDFVAVGDTVTDEFIELDDVRIDTDRDEGDKGYDEICFRFGDKVGYKGVVIVPAVGNSANAAVSATRLGLEAAFVSNIGDDELGKKKLEALKANGVNTEFVKVHKGMPSNHHYVLRYKEERTILIRHQLYDYSFPEVPAPKWIYFSSVAENALPYHTEIAEYLKKNKKTKLAFQPGTFQIKLGYEKIKDLYELSELFFCNKDEAKRILKTKEEDIKKLLEKLHGLGPKVAIITDGPRGAYTYDGNETWYIPMYPDPKPPVDRTGAGDSFASTFTAALALGKTIPEALSWGPVNSMSVVQYIGAQEGLLTQKKLEQLLTEAPENYKPTKI